MLSNIFFSYSLTSTSLTAPHVINRYSLFKHQLHICWHRNFWFQSLVLKQLKQLKFLFPLIYIPFLRQTLAKKYCQYTILAYLFQRSPLSLFLSQSSPPATFFDSVLLLALLVKYFGRRIMSFEYQHLVRKHIPVELHIPRHQCRRHSEMFTPYVVS